MKPGSYRCKVPTTPAEKRKYRDAAHAQLLLWVNGKSVHVNDECCPDFSCCYPDMLMPFEERVEYLREYEARAAMEPRT